MSAKTGADRIVQSALNHTPAGLHAAVGMVGQVVAIVEHDIAYDEGERAMALLAMYGLVHRALLGLFAGEPDAVEEAGHEQQ